MKTTNKTKWAFLLLLASGIYTTSLRAQQANDTAGLHELKVGDTVPSVSWGYLMGDNKSTVSHVSLNKKPVIIYFWTTYCGTCIEAFPKLENLQRQFGNNVKIILANPLEDAKTIKRRFNGMHRVIPELPIIPQATTLNSLFPHPFAAHTVWIDHQGVVRLRGATININEDKIKAFIAGKSLSYLPDPKGYWSEGRSPLVDLLEMPIKNAANYSLISRALISFGRGGGMAEGIIDSSRGTIRNSYINFSVLQLYNLALAREMRNAWKSNLYAFKYWMPYLDRFELKVSDTLRYSPDFIPQEKRTDKNILSGIFCYEQVLPDTTTIQNQRKSMLEDLNQYFMEQYGTYAQLERREELAYIIQRTSTVNKLASTANAYSEKMIISGKDTLLQITRGGLAGLIPKVIQADFFPGKTHLLLDETNLSGKIDIKLPYKRNGLNPSELNAALKPYGLQLITENRLWYWIVIKENIEAQ